MEQKQAESVVLEGVPVASEEQTVAPEAEPIASEPESSKSVAPEAEAVAPEPEASTLGQEIVAGIIGAVVATMCVLPPIVHLVLGPFGPFLGGFIAANRVNPGTRGRIVIAALVGSGLAGLLGVLATLLLSFAERSELPDWFPSSATLGAILGGIWVYGVLTSTIGISVACSLAAKKRAAN